MTSLLGLVLLVVIAYAGALIFQKYETNNFVFKVVSYTGLLYLLLGYLIGPRSINLLNPDILNNLNVLFALVLGWVGFLIGLQMNWSGLKRFPFSYYRYSSLNFVITYLLSILLLYLFTKQVFTYSIETQNLLVLALAGAVTSPIMLAVVIRENRVRARLSHLLQFQAAYDNILGIVFILILLIGFSLTTNINIADFWLKQSIVITVALICAYVYKYLVKEKFTAEENLLYILGLILFLVGISLYLGSSILLATMVLGLGLANITKKRRKLYHSIQQVEKPMYVLLLIYAGLNIDVPNNSFLIVLFLLAHLFSKIVADYVARKSLPSNERHSGMLGLANTGMGGLSLAIILDYFVYNSYRSGQYLITVVVVGLLVSDMLALYYLRKKIVSRPI